MAFIIFFLIAVLVGTIYVRSQRAEAADRQAGIERSRFGAVFSSSKRRGSLVVAIVFGVAALLECITVVPAGHVGVIDFFGHVSDRTLKSGINLVNPLARVVKFSIKTQEIKEIMDVPSKEGLTVQLEVSALFLPRNFNLSTQT